MRFLSCGERCNSADGRPRLAAELAVLAMLRSRHASEPEIVVLITERNQMQVKAVSDALRDRARDREREPVHLFVPRIKANGVRSSERKHEILWQATRATQRCV